MMAQSTLLNQIMPRLMTARSIIIVSIMLVSQLIAVKGHTENIYFEVKKGDLAKVKEAVSRDPSIVRKNSGQLLPLAAYWNNLQMVSYLMEMGADINALDLDHHTALFYAIDKRNLEMMRYLIEHGADLEDCGLVSPMLMAVYQNNMEMVGLLLDSGAKVNGIEKYESSLHASAGRGWTEMTEYLISRGAQVNLQRTSTALHASVCYNYHDASSTDKDRHYQTVIILLKNGADPSITNRQGQAPLHLAAHGKDVKIVNLLLENGADPNARDRSGNTPLHIAALDNNLEMVIVLIRHGADKKIRNKRGQSASRLINEIPLRVLKNIGGWVLYKMLHPIPVPGEP